MIERTVRIRFSVGLHARPATKFVKLVKGFESSITIRNLSRGGEEVDAKSLVKVIKISCAQDQEVGLRFTGPDEEQAAEAILKFLNSPESEL